MSSSIVTASARTRASEEQRVRLDAKIRALLPDYPGGGKIQEAPQRGQVPGPREQDPKSISRDEHAARHVPRGGVPRGGGRVVRRVG